MERSVRLLLILGLYVVCYGQTPTPTSPTTTPNPYPDPHGMIMTIKGPSRDSAQLRHLEIYPGYENFSGSVPGIGFTNKNIHFLSVDYDYRSKCIYMYDIHLRSIAIGCGYNTDLNVSQMTFAFMHVGVSRGTVQIAVDWLSHTVYWSDSVFRWIVAAPGQNDTIDLDYYKIIVDEHLESPDGLAVDPLEGLLFWTDNGKHPKIERSTTSGKKRKTIIPKKDSMTGYHLQSPLSLEVDINEKRIYWIDSVTESILSSTYDGDNIISIQRVPDSTLFDIGLFKEVVYVSDIQNSNLLTLNKTDGLHKGKRESTTINIYPETIYGIAVYGKEKQPLTDTDYCKEKKCEQMCLSKKGDAECVCAEGYSFNSTGQCQATYRDYHKAIVVVNITHVCFVDLRAFAHVSYDMVCKFTLIKPQPTQPPTTTVVPPTASNATSTPRTTTPRTTTPSTPAPTVSPSNRFKMFDMDMENRVFFFVTESNVIYQRAIDLPIENEAKEPIAYPSKSVTGIAFDPIAKNKLYWCEAESGLIYELTIATKSPRSILDNVKITNVRDLMFIVDERRLAMLAGNTGDMSITTVTTEGLDSVVVVSEIQNIAAFAYDREKKRFYYISGTYMFSVMFDGTDNRREFSGVDRGTYHLVLYKNYLTWLFQTATYKHLVRTRDMTTGRNIALGYFDRSTLVDMKVLDIVQQKSNVSSPCAYENGNCEQICITHYENDAMTKLCVCKTGYTLAKDKSSCISVVLEDDFILASDWTFEQIRQIDLINNTVRTLPSGESDVFMGVYYDSDTKKVIWAKYYDYEINSANLNGTERTVLSTAGNNGFAYRFDKDKTTKNLYFTAYDSTFIGVISASGYTIELETDFGFDDLGDIVVHPGKGWMYFTVIGWRKSYIGRSDMDGANLVEIISGNHVDYPDGLAIDYINDYLYWSDATYDTIQRCDLGGKNCVTILNMTSTYRDEEIRDLATDSVYLYYSAYRKDHIMKLDLSSPTYERTKVSENPGLGKLDTISFYSSKDKNIQPVSPGCRDRNGLGDCSTICLPTPTGRTCACQAGESIKSDGRTCTDIYQCTDIIQQKVTLLSKKEIIIDITIDESCLRHLNDKCKYKCPTNFVPIYTELLLCTNNGWDKDTKFTPLCRERRCPATIKNGQLDKNCQREIGEKCDFTCNAGFRKRRKYAVCTTDETYHLPDEELCEPFMCSDTIPNGALAADCAKTIGASCKYSCNGYYVPTDKKAQVICRSSGWSPSETDLCKESLCDDSSLPNGMLPDTCIKKIGEACTYQCSKGFINTTYLAVCKRDRMWHPSGACKVARCPATIPNGFITKSCDFAIGSKCNFGCTSGFLPNTIYKNAVCDNTGQWDKKETLCYASVSISEKQTQTLSTPGVAAGFVVLLLILIALVVVSIFLYRRNANKSASTYSTASFNKEANGIEIENPGYRPENSQPSSQPKDEHHYSSVDPSQMQPMSFTGMEASSDAGISNPMYDKEPLPEVSQVDLTQDKARLTYDSWLKEREKEKEIDNKY